MESSEVNIEIVNELNEVFPKGNCNLSDIIEYKNRIEKSLIDIKETFTLNNQLATLDVLISDCETKLKDISTRINRIIEEYDVHSRDIIQCVVSSGTEHLQKIELLEKSSKYLSVLDHIEIVSTKINLNLSEKNDSRVVKHFKYFCSLHDTLNSSNCNNIKKFVKDTVLYWHEVLKCTYMKDMEDVLKILKWPFVSHTVPTVPTVDILAKFQSLLEILINIQLPDSLIETSINLPMVVLVSPLRKRFMYHFAGARQTNQVEKPEWYFTQILTWIRDHQDFIEKNVQPVFDRLQIKLIAGIEFMKHLIELVKEKLEKVLPEIQYDDVLFSHTIDEALGFHRELTMSYNYPECGTSVISVLTQPNFYLKWINLERKYSIEKLDDVFRSESAFQRINLNEKDSLGTTESVDRFITLLSTLTDRYSCLPQPGHQLMFLELQLDLLDDFRTRLVQIIRQEKDYDLLNTMIPHILNSVSSLVEVLQEWDVTPHFLRLYYYKQQLSQLEESSVSKSIFGEMCDIFSKMRDDLLKLIVDSVFIDVKAKTLPYRKDRWQAKANLAEGEVSATSTAMFRTLTLQLHALYNLLTKPLFIQAVHLIAKDLDWFLFDELVCKNVFSPDGAKQLDYDVSRNLMPLFGQYFDKPELYFKLLKDSCMILTLNQGSALLLKSTLTNEFFDFEALNDLGVFTLKPKQVHDLLQRRTDLLSN